MNGTQTQAGYQSAHQESATATKTKFGAAMLESIGAMATIALAIVGLTGTFAISMAAIATIVLGAALWMESGGLAASRWSTFSSEGYAAHSAELLDGSLGAEFLGGVAAIVLGILALLGVSSIELVSVAVLALGASFLFSGRSGYGSEARLLFGASGVVLGILAICHLNQLALVLVGLLSLGAGALFGGAGATTKSAMELHK